MSPDQDLSLRERAIIELASGTTPEFTARMLEVTRESVDQLARSLGWPGTLRTLKSTATAIRAGNHDHRGYLPPADAPGDAVPTPDAAVPAPVAEASSSISADRRVFRLPLRRLIDADGTETIVAEAVVEVSLDLTATSEWLTSGANEVPPFGWTVRQALTPDGAAAIRSLAQLLDGAE